MAQGPPERSDIPARYRWKPEHLFASDAAWNRERTALLRSIRKLTAHKGKLRSATAILACLDASTAAEKRYDRLANYAHRRHDEDTRVAKYQGMKEIVEKVGAELSTATSYVEPELLALPAGRLRTLIADRRFASYDRYLKELLRQKRHVLSPAEEALLARTSLMHDAAHNAYATFSGADLTFDEIRDERGKKVRLTQSLFSRYRASPKRKVRRGAFETFFGAYARYKNTLASLLSAQINANLTYARARNYRTALEAALDDDALPTTVYTQMVKAANKHLPLLHRYLKLRQRRLGLKHLRYHDLYPPIVDEARLTFSHEQACKIVIEATRPLGDAYCRDLSAGLSPEAGWLDVRPNAGKRSGGYMDGSAYDAHPYVLLNSLDDYNSLGTLAHEMGHAMHSFYSNRRQPYPKADYSIFVAEVASTLNEALVDQYLFERMQKPAQRLYLLGERLEGFRQTFFRQAMFAEFELALYRLAEAGEALTAERLSAVYLETARRYYGHDQGVVEVDERYAIEWAHVPHFYYNFYVFQYVTGITAATALAEGIVAKGAPAAKRYVEQMLHAGCSDTPLRILKRAGVDLTTDKPYAVTMSVFSRALEQAEALTER